MAGFKEAIETAFKNAVGFALDDSHTVERGILEQAGVLNVEKKRTTGNNLVLTVTLPAGEGQNSPLESLAGRLRLEAEKGTAQGTAPHLRVELQDNTLKVIIEDSVSGAAFIGRVHRNMVVDKAKAHLETAMDEAHAYFEQEKGEGDLDQRKAMYELVETALSPYSCYGMANRTAGDPTAIGKKRGVLGTQKRQEILQGREYAAGKTEKELVGDIQESIAMLERELSLRDEKIKARTIIDVLSDVFSPYGFSPKALQKNGLRK